jgi:type IV pilus assembly protein PilX
MSMMERQVRVLHRQSGAVLIVALVLLLVLTLLGTASIRDTTMEERMAGNFRDYAAALEAAETALRIGEQGVAHATTHGLMVFDDKGVDADGVFFSSVSIDPMIGAHYRRTVSPSTLTYDSNLLVSAVPRYYIEKLPETVIANSDLAIGTQNQPPKVHYYRVTSKGFGISSNSEVILQSTYFSWNGND